MKKLGLVAIALVLALGALGVGYALWSQQLVINGSAQMADLKVEFSAAAADNATTTQYVTFGSGPTIGPDSLANPNAVISAGIVNMWPGSQAVIDFTVKNTGTMPVTTNVTGIVGAKNWGGHYDQNTYFTVTINQTDGSPWNTSLVLNANDTVSGKMTITMLATAPAWAEGHTNTVTDYLMVIGAITATQAY